MCDPPKNSVVFFLECVWVSVHFAGEASERQEDGRLRATAARSAPEKKQKQINNRSSDDVHSHPNMLFCWGGVGTWNPGQEGRFRYTSAGCVEESKETNVAI